MGELDCHMTFNVSCSGENCSKEKPCGIVHKCEEDSSSSCKMANYCIKPCRDGPDTEMIVVP